MATRTFSHRHRTFELGNHCARLTLTADSRLAGLPNLRNAMHIISMESDPIPLWFCSLHLMNHSISAYLSPNG